MTMRGLTLLNRARELFEQEALLLPGLYVDHEVYELEKERIFAKTWIFLAHESEIPRPGDYVVRYVCDDSFLVCRTDSGEIRVLYNMCRHRGAQLCRAERGNTSTFVCPYHGWTFKNTGELVGVPYEAEIFGSQKLDKKKWSLYSPRVEKLYGMIFVNLDPDAPSLREFLAGAEWYLAFYFEGGLKVCGPPHRWIVHANWKVGEENFIGDDYHVGFLHRSTLQVGIIPAEYDFLKHGVMVHCGPWGGFFISSGFPPFVHHPAEALEGIRQKLTPEQVAIVERRLLLGNSSLFPNLSFLVPGAPYLTVRIWRPLGAEQMEIWSWCFVPEEAPEEFTQEAYRAYILQFGPSGTVEQDDTEAWNSITRACRGMLANRIPLNSQMGLNHWEPIADWPGPGTAYPFGFTEFNQRHFWRLYFKYMLG